MTQDQIKHIRDESIRILTESGADFMAISPETVRAAGYLAALKAVQRKMQELESFNAENQLGFLRAYVGCEIPLWDNTLDRLIQKDADFSKGLAAAQPLT